MKRWKVFAAGFGAGAAAMYLLDPERGAERRSTLSRRLRGMSRSAKGAMAGDAGARTMWSGLQDRWRAMWQGSPVTDDRLERKIAHELAKVLRDASLIRVHVDHGRVTLAGSVHAEDAAAAVRCAEDAPGVVAVDSRLELRH